jgi:hypothetical protein
MLDVAGEVVSSTGRTTSCNPSAVLVMENLMAHFFSPMREDFCPEDVQWFLQLANTPKQWRFHEDLDTVAGGLQDDTIPQTKVNAYYILVSTPPHRG